MEVEFLYDVPDILYKFRDWDNPNSHALLYGRELFFSSYSHFNDPFDGGIPFQYDPKDLTPDKIFRKYYESAKQLFPGKSETEIHEICFEQQREGNFENDRFLKEFQDEVKADLARKFGIVCLCKSPSNFLLWSYYADSHKGFAIGFNKRELFRDTQARFAHMIYRAKLPMLGLFDDADLVFTKLLGTKSVLWEHEDEYRLSRANFVDRTVTVGRDTVADITCGCKMDQRIRDEILEYVKAEIPHATIHVMEMSRKEFEITRHRIY